MRILVWHVHGGWMDSFVRGAHEYLLPATAERGSFGLGRGGRDWPAGVREVSPHELRNEEVDIVVLQRLEEIPEAERLLGRKLGRDVAAVFVEHNTPKENPVSSRHPLADQREILIAHVTHFNELMWDCGMARTTVVEHGIPDPGALYTGELPAFGVVINEPVRRWRVTGTDLLPRFVPVAPLHVFGMGAEELPGALGLPRADLLVGGDLPPAHMHAELARRQVYLHLLRWTSLGLALLEAMYLGMPVVALATTEASRAVPPGAGAISTDLDELVRAARRLVNEPGEARECGAQARRFVHDHYGLPAFLRTWDAVIDEEVSKIRSRAVRRIVPLTATKGSRP